MIIDYEFLPTSRTDFSKHFAFNSDVHTLLNKCARRIIADYSVIFNSNLIKILELTARSLSHASIVPASEFRTKFSPRYCDALLISQRRRRSCRRPPPLSRSRLVYLMKPLLFYRFHLYEIQYLTLYLRVRS